MDSAMALQQWFALEAGCHYRDLEGRSAATTRVSDMLHSMQQVVKLWPSGHVPVLCVCLMWARTHTRATLASMYTRSDSSLSATMEASGSRQDAGQRQGKDEDEGEDEDEEGDEGGGG